MALFGIVLAVFSLLFPATAAAQEEREPKVLVYGAQDRPVAGSTWVLTLLVDHSEPNEVDVRAPHFTGSLIMDQLIKGPRHRNPDTGQTFTSLPRPVTTWSESGGFQTEEVVYERWTAMEYRFTLSGPGTIYFDSFTITTPYGQARTAPFSLQVQRSPSASAVQRFQLVWEGAPSGLKIGESAVFSLRVRNWNSAMPLPESAAFAPSLPQGHILESLPVSMEEKSEGMALRLRLIPVEAIPFTVEKRQFSHNSLVFEIPLLNIPVTAVKTDSALPVRPERTEADRPLEKSSPSFPPLETAANARLYKQYQAECETIYGTAKNLWERGYRANALATLRQNERDHPAGTLFAAIRREAEAALGFAATNDEKKQLPFLRGKSHSAVLKETEIRHIPDPAGEVTGRFREGQPVIITITGGTVSKQREVMMRVIANDSSGTGGWVPAENIIFY